MLAVQDKIKSKGLTDFVSQMRAQVEADSNMSSHRISSGREANKHKTEMLSPTSNVHIDVGLNLVDQS